MLDKARRRAPCRLRGFARRALLMACLWPTSLMANPEVIVGADYASPTNRYPHGVLGDDREYGALVLRFASGGERQFILPETSVFEDTAPRLADLDGDGAPEVIVVESDQSKGARLVVYGQDGRITATPYIGTRFRWLAPLGAADLDGDGVMEIAFVDRPHLAKTLRIWRYKSATLTQVATFAGVTNHRIGEEDIAGGIRTCEDGPEMILADASWQSLLALRFDGNEITLRQIGIDTTRPAFADAMACRN
jgi:hypothetical protein